MDMITNYEVEGCWTSIPPAGNNEPSRCRRCGTILELTPKEKHFNSKYWSLQQLDGLLLANCPEGCSVKDAKDLMLDYLKFYRYCTEGSQSYKYEMDYERIDDAWVSPNGQFYPVPPEGHNDFAYDEMDCLQDDLENKGWAKISKGCEMVLTNPNIKVTNRQKESLFDFFIAKGYDTTEIYNDSFLIYIVKK